jgi:GntR family transcriptional repressor for pyruvate dehydrogenase complex
MRVSRTVIREAIKLLESKGLVRIVRGVGTTVAEARKEHVSDPLKLLLRRKLILLKHLTEVRRILEAGMAGLAAERRTAANLATMKRLLELMHDKPSQAEAYVDADLEFHAEIGRATQNPAMSILLAPLSELLRESRIASFSGSRVTRLRVEQHAEILRMIEQQNTEGAKEAMSKHLSDTLIDLERPKSKNQDR